MAGILRIFRRSPQPESHAGHIIEWNHDLEATGFDLQEVKLLDVWADRPAADLFNYAYPVVGINDFVANAEALRGH